MQSQKDFYLELANSQLDSIFLYRIKEDGKVQSLDFSVAGIVRAEDEKTIIGYIEVDTKTDALYLRKNESTETLVLGESFGDAAETIVVKNILIISSYYNIATGADLAAYDIETGKVIWHADVKQLKVGHSEYYNKVILSLYNDKVIMEGIEAYGSYVQIFDCKTGKRLYVSDTF